MSPQAASKARIWTILAIFISLVLAVLAGLLVIQPMWQATTEANEAAEEQESRNDNEQRQVNVLKTQFAQIDDYRELLEELRVQVPTTLQTQEFQRQLADIVDGFDVTVTSLKFEQSTEVTITNGEADAAAMPIAAVAREETTPPPADPASPTEDSDAGEGDGEAPKKTPEQLAAEQAAKRRFTGFYTVPVKFDITGPYREVLEVVRAIQNTDRRLILISKITATAGTTTGSSESGSSAPSEGDLVLNIEGQLSVLLDPEAKTALPDDETVERPELPNTEGKDQPLTGG